MASSKQNPAILYEVVIEVAPDIRAGYLVWLRDHVRAMLQIEGFLSAEVFEDADSPCAVTCHYRLADMTAMDAYLAGPAADMRADGVRRFGDKISARRRILTELT